MESLEHTVLIVDDTSERLELVSKFMRQADFHVITARDATEAFEVARREHPSLVISDVVMPNTSGIELTRMIRDDDELRATPILLMSALDKETASVVEALHSGADGYVEVPFEAARVVAKATRLIERRRAGQ